MFKDEEMAGMEAMVYCQEYSFRTEALLITNVGSSEFLESPSGNHEPVPFSRTGQYVYVGWEGRERYIKAWFPHSE